MTASHCNHLRNLQPLPAATRGNLLALSAASEPATALWTSLQRLEQLGYGVDEVQPRHWRLTLAPSTLEIHLYGEAELTGFTRGRACVYSIRAARAIGGSERTATATTQT